MRVLRPLRAGAAGLVLVAALVTVPAGPAVADTIPPTHYAPLALTGMTNPQFALSYPGGGVMVGCSGGSNAAKSVDVTGAVAQTLAYTDVAPNVCAHTSAVGADGTVYADVRVGAN